MVNFEKKNVEINELIKLVGRYWEILTTLSNNKYNLSSLAHKLRRDRSQISKQVKKLVEKGLVSYEREEGGRRKYYFVTDEVNMVIKEIKSFGEFKPKGKLEEWQIESFLTILESSSGPLRRSFAESFAFMCRKYPLEVVSYPRVRKLFEQAIQGSLDEYVAAKLRGCMPFVLRYVSRYKDRIEWVNRKIYPLLERCAELGDEQTRFFAIKVIGEIAVNSVDPFLKNKAEKKLAEIWYSPNTDPYGKFGEEVLKWLVLLSPGWLFEDAKTKVKDCKYKAKAELVLERLKEILIPKE